MNKWQGNAIIVLLALILIALVVNMFTKETAQKTKKLQTTKKVKLIKWQYKIRFIKDSDFDWEMYELGNDGWELAFARRAHTDPDKPGDVVFGYECIFKKPLK